MKHILSFLTLILLAGCDYDAPLSETASAPPANRALAGNWIQQDEEQQYRMDLQVSENKYVVTYGKAGESPITFKGFEVNAGDLRLIQLELQGTDSEKYLFVKYELTPDHLLVYRLNTAVVSAKCQTSDELLNDIAVHRQNPFLFGTPMTFPRSAAQ